VDGHGEEVDRKREARKAKDEQRPEAELDHARRGCAGGATAARVDPARSRHQLAAQHERCGGDGEQAAREAARDERRIRVHDGPQQVLADGGRGNDLEHVRGRREEQ